MTPREEFEFKLKLNSISNHDIVTFTSRMIHAFFKELEKREENIIDVGFMISFVPAEFLHPYERGQLTLRSKHYDT